MWTSSKYLSYLYLIAKFRPVISVIIRAKIKVSFSDHHFNFQAELDEQRHDLACEKRTRGEKCRLYTVRFFINFLIIIMLGGAGAAIYYAQDYSTDVCIFDFTVHSDFSCVSLTMNIQRFSAFKPTCLLIMTFHAISI